MQEENIRIFSNQTHGVVRDYPCIIKSYKDGKLLFDVRIVVFYYGIVFNWDPTIFDYSVQLSVLYKYVAYIWSFWRSLIGYVSQETFLF